MEKSCKKYTSKASRRLILILVNNPKQSLHARNSVKSKIFWKGIVKNPLFNEQSYQKQKGPGNSDQSLFRFRNKFTKILY